MSPYVMQRDPRFFKDPERFMPERWQDPSTAALPRFAYFPFGGGARVCIGNHFATMEVQLVLATLVQHLELTVTPGFKLELEPIVTLRPKNGLQVRVRRLRDTPATQLPSRSEPAPASPA
jgi:cytochrome P450